METSGTAGGRTGLERAIAYFARRHVLTNLIFLSVLAGGATAWVFANKEELPSVTFDFASISVRYPGATAEDVEHFVTRPIEEEIRPLDGVYRLTSTSSVGQANVMVELEPDLPNVDDAITEIRNAVLDVDYPDDVIDDPEIRVFKTSKKAILDVALLHRGAHILDPESRRELQKYAFALENRLLAAPEIHGVDRTGYLPEEIHIRTFPDRLTRFEIPLNTLMSEIRANHVRQPAGTLDAEGEPKVTLLSELTTPERLRGLIVQGGFEGRVVRLGEVAEIAASFEKTDTVLKVNGHEAVMFNVVKSPAYGILVALDAAERIVSDFRRTNLKGTPIEVVLLDDESMDVRNRISLIGVNGAIGFVLILGTLFLFLNKRSGFWVAMGIPFTLCFTLIAATGLGYTVNGTTLAAVIIVLGMIVDDAIVVAENITRLLARGVERALAVVEGTAYVFLPIFASIATTCVAFAPLFFFGGRYGKFNSHLPPIVFLMLAASLFESLFILPGHMSLEGRRARRGERSSTAANGRWFDHVENGYGWLLERLLRWRLLVIACLTALLVFSGWLAREKMKFVLFPNEETRDIVLTGETPPGSTRYETAAQVRAIEDLVAPYLGEEVVGYRTEVARSRRGGAAEENRFQMLIEIVPREERERSADQIIEEIETGFGELEGFSRLAFRKSRWGQESGSPVEILVQQNDDALRREIVEDLAATLRTMPSLANVEIDEGLFLDEYRIDIDREKIKRLSITPTDIASTLRAALEGTVLYEFSNGEEEVRVRLTTVDEAKTDIQKVLRVPVENRGNYLVPLGDLVSVERVSRPSSISRYDMKRTTRVYADLAPDTETTPLEVAHRLESDVFPDVLGRHPTTNLAFTGEILETRESTQSFQISIAFALLLIYVILAILFDSPWKPLVIMLAVPFGIVGVILAFVLHGKLLFGFFAAVGALGLTGVVVNDSIILVTKLEDELDSGTPRAEAAARIAEIAKTRLRAVVLTTLTTIAGLAPTAYGLAGYDAMLAEMMLALTWGLAFGTVITLVLVPCLHHLGHDLGLLLRGARTS